MANSTAYNIDCMEYMATLKDNYFELAIVDPPYGIGNFLHSSSNYVPENIEWNNKIPSPEYFQDLFRVSKHQIIWGGNYYAHILPITNSWILWDKKNGDPIKSHFSNSEVAWTSFNTAMNCVCLPWPNGFYRGKKEGIQIHPCQKSIAIYKWILANYARPGWKIFDTHLGSGSSRIAAYDLGFDFIGCEISDKYFEAQEERFKDYMKQKEIFNKKEYQNIIYSQNAMEDFNG